MFKPAQVASNLYNSMLDFKNILFYYFTAINYCLAFSIFLNESNLGRAETKNIILWMFTPKYILIYPVDIVLWKVVWGRSSELVLISGKWATEQVVAIFCAIFLKLACLLPRNSRKLQIMAWLLKVRLELNHLVCSLVPLDTIPNWLSSVLFPSIKLQVYAYGIKWLVFMACFFLNIVYQSYICEMGGHINMIH